MKKVLKFCLETTFGPQAIKMPLGAVVISVGKQAEQLRVWVEVDEDVKEEFEYTFYVVGTGHPVPEQSKHVGTVPIDPYIWHIYIKWIYEQ